jgi:hypothetical protein
VSNQGAVSFVGGSVLTDDPDTAALGDATVTVLCVAASIGTQPAPKTVTAGQTATLTVAAAGEAPLTYQWYRGASGDTTSPVGTGSSSFTTPPVTGTSSYWVRVTNDCGSVDSGAATVNFATMTQEFTGGVEPVPDWSEISGSWSLTGTQYATDVATAFGYSNLAHSASLSDYEVETAWTWTTATAPPSPAAVTLWLRGEPLPLVTTGKRWNSGYAFQIARNGMFSVYAVNGTAAPVAKQAWVTSGAIGTASGATNTLVARVQGQTLTLSINGAPVWIGSDPTFASGRVGVSHNVTNAYLTDRLLVERVAIRPPMAGKRAAEVSAEQERANRQANLNPRGTLEGAPVD